MHYSELSEASQAFQDNTLKKSPSKARKVLAELSHSGVGLGGKQNKEKQLIKSKRLAEISKLIDEKEQKEKQRQEKLAKSITLQVSKFVKSFFKR